MRSTLVYTAGSLIILFCAAGFYHVYEKAGLPVAFQPGSLLVENVSQPCALQPGDRLIAIDGAVIASIDEAEFILDSKTVGKTVTIAVDRDGLAVHTSAVLVRFFSPRYLVIQLIAAAIFIFLGMFVYSKRKEDRAARMFNWASLFAALIISATWGKFNIAPLGLGYAVRACFHIAYACSGVLFLHFTFLFPSTRSKWTPRFLLLLYVAAVGLAGLSTYCFIQAVHTMSLEVFRIYNTVFNGMRLFFAASVIAGLVSLVHTYRTAREESERRQLRWILLGLIVGPLCYVVLWVLPQIFASRGIVAEEFILLLMLSVPVTFAIAIVKYHIMDIDLIFKRTTVYTMALSAVLVIYVAAVSILSLTIGRLTVAPSLLVSTIAAAAVAALFHPIRSRTQRFVDKRFFNVRYNFREAEKEFVEQIIFCYDEASIRAAVTDIVRRNILNSGTSLFLLSESADAPPCEQLLTMLREHEAPLFLGDEIEPGAKFVEADAAVFGGSRTSGAFRVYSKSSGLLGCLMLGPKLSGFRYNLEDVDLLESFCHQTALALDRVSLQRSLISEHLETDRLKDLNDLKSYFVSAVSHELKTPLTSIRLFAELMEETPKLGERKRSEYLQIIKGESERLSRLIDDVLDLSKIEKGMKEYRFMPVDLNECVTEAGAAMQFQFALHGFECRIRLARKPLIICADRDALLQVLFNLLSNAVKYSAQKKKITISTTATPEGARLDVQDSGIGIAEADLKKIFEPFERSASPLVRTTSGTGLGLALVRHIAEAHRARLDVRSTLGKGSTFSLTFPFITSGSAA